MPNPDAIIVGGGIVGCAAYYLSPRGMRVLVLERDSIGAESSGANPGVNVLPKLEPFLR